MLLNSYICIGLCCFHCSQRWFFTYNWCWIWKPNRKCGWISCEITNMVSEFQFECMSSLRIRLCKCSPYKDFLGPSKYFQSFLILYHHLYFVAYRDTAGQDRFRSGKYLWLISTLRRPQFENFVELIVLFRLFKISHTIVLSRSSWCIISLWHNITWFIQCIIRMVERCTYIGQPKHCHPTGWQ